MSMDIYRRLSENICSSVKIKILFSSIFSRETLKSEVRQTTTLLAYVIYPACKSDSTCTKANAARLRGWAAPLRYLAQLFERSVTAKCA